MMKRFLACLAAVACLLSVFAVAEESVDMRVIKCSERVNIRQYPNTDANIVGKAPLGAVLIGCQKAARSADWYAVVYDGVAGYIRGDFLEAVDAAGAPVAEEAAPAEAPAEAPAPDASSDAVEEYDPAEEAVEEAVEEEPAAAVESAAADAPLLIEVPVVVDEPLPVEAPAETVEEPAPVEAAAAEPIALPAVENAPIANIADASGYEGDEVILDADVGGVHVVARRIYESEREYMAVAGLDAEGNQIWKQETATNSITELTLTDAFIGGIAGRPLVMLYNAEVGLCAIDASNGAIRWLLGKDDVSLGASISHAVGGMGVLYIGGYYGPDPVAIDANGRVLWQSNSGSDDIYWLYDIELQSDGIACAYDNVDGEGTSGTVVYDYNGVRIS